MSEIVEEARELNPVSGYGMFDMYKAVHTSQMGVLGNVANFYTGDFVSVLDEAILTDNMYILSKEQQAHMDTYFSEADGTLSDEMEQLDKFLGEYIGETDG